MLGVIASPLGAPSTSSSQAKPKALTVDQAQAIINGEAVPVPTSDCTFVANLHVRKCGGTTVRHLFEELSSGGVWEQSAGYCTAMNAHAHDEKNKHGFHWSETHCDEDIGHFNEGVKALREQLEPAGCKVISTLLLRDPVDQLASEWVYFNTEPDKEGTDTPLEWSPRAPENMLRWLLHAEGDLWNGDGKLPSTVQPAEGEPLDIANCTAALSYVDEQMSQIDLVGTMDTPEQFAQWWVALGDMAGFDAQITPQKENTMGGPLIEKATLDDSQRATVLKRNSCGKRVRDEAYQRLQVEVKQHAVDSKLNAMAPSLQLRSQSALAAGAASDFDARVAALVRKWGGVIPNLDAED